MNTDPVKNIGKIKEQIETEYKSRRNYPKKWSRFYDETPWNEMYNQTEINNKLKTDLKDQTCPFNYSNEGDSYFVSPEMHKSLVAVCRCGRPRSGLHLIKCLQTQQNKYLLNDANLNPDEKKISINKLPETSSGFVGWQSKQPSYKQWENSMKYISPMYDMPGEKITATPYNAIIIVFSIIFIVIVCCCIQFSQQQFPPDFQFNQLRPFGNFPRQNNINSQGSGLNNQNWLGPGQQLVFATTTSAPGNSVVFVNNQPAVPTMVPFIAAATTPTPQFLDCFSRCPTTSEFNPICASNRQQYGNEQKFNCARQCGADIEIVRRGSCEGLFPIARG
ncbi:hypothetical protein CVS40_8004 [Lucilia cuprina]|nr:hypothetical protein CVS40_8004 [Lucilia cuprina]